MTIVDRDMLNEFLFTKIEARRILAIFDFNKTARVTHSEATLDILRPVIEDRIISRRPEVVWPTPCCDLTPLDYYL